MKRLISLFSQKNNKGKVVRNTSYLFISEVILKGLGVLWIILLARSLSVSNFGIYNVVTSFLAIFSFFPDFGIGIIIIREIASNKKKASKLLGASLILSASFSILTFFISISTAIFIRYSIETTYLIAISAFMLVASTVRSTAIFYFDGIEKMKHSAILNTINTILLISFGALFFFFTKSLYGIFLGMLSGTLISLLISYNVLFSNIKISFKFPTSLLKEILSSSWPLGVAAFAFLIYSRIDTIILSKLLGDSAAGIYGAASPFPQALIQLGNVPFMVALFPTLTKIYSEDYERFKKAYLKSLGVIAIWSIPASILISLSSPILIPFIFGDKYDQAIQVLRILIFTVPFISMWALLYKILLIMNRQKDYLFISMIGAVSSIILNFILIPQLGLTGAAWAAVVTQFLLLIMYSIDVFIRLNINEKRTK